MFPLRIPLWTSINYRTCVELARICLLITAVKVANKKTRLMPLIWVNKEKTGKTNVGREPGRVIP